MDFSDIKEKIEQMVSSVTKDPEVMSQFKRDPAKAVEKVLGVDLPDDVVDKVVSGVKGKLGADKLSDMGSALKKLF